MKTEIWSIENGALVCNYENYTGKTGVETFKLKKIETDTVLGTPVYSFFKEGTQYILGRVSWCNLCKCYTALYNNTKLTAFIKADLSQLL